MSAAFEFKHRVEFVPENSAEILRSIPAAPGVFALRGADENAEPYLTRAADMRRRMRRLLAPPEEVDEQGRPVLSKRLNLRERVRWIEYTRTGSEFESALVVYCATRAAFGAEAARKRLRLYPPYFLRITVAHEHPRVYATNRLSRRALGEFFGPFPSRAAAERYGDAVLDLFKLRRCHEDLQPFPEHPGCVYGEMKKCIEPCKQACSAEEYAAETERVAAFFRTRGESMLSDLARERDAASEAMDFERAAAVHAQWEKVRAAAQQADELVRPVLELRAVVVQQAAPGEENAQDAALDAALFLLEGGRIAGPERLSTLGVRAVREQTAVGSSLFAQPLMLAAVPLEEQQAETGETAEKASPEAMSAEAGGIAAGTAAMLSPEDRARAALEHLHGRARAAGEPEISERCDFLSLFRRWYYRPEKQRAGEVFLPNADGSWPVRRILNASARAVLGPLAEVSPVDREAFKGKTKVLHEGREGVERVVPVLPKRGRTRRAVTPTDLQE